MNDQELTSAVKQQFASIRMSTPLDSIAVRGQALSTRRRLRALAGACATLGTASALAVMALPPAASTVPATLTAWTVAKAPDGTVTVTIRDLRDPARLQARLRMDGIPASVTSFNKPTPACGSPRRPVSDLKGIFSAPPRDRNEQVIVIHPSALPPGVGVQLRAAWETGPRGLSSANDSGRGHHRPTQVALGLGLVGTSPACTG
jgi:hypothetical protein